LALVQQMTESPVGPLPAGPDAVSGGTQSGRVNGAEEASTSIARLFTAAYSALLGVLGRAVSAETDVVAARHRLRNMATRLQSRALRPLAEALCKLTDDPTRLLMLETSSDSTSLEDRLRTLAVSATQVRVEVEVAPPELLEATAALQDLALTYATSSDVDSTALLEQFRNTERALPRSIQLVYNGPYLLSNVDQLSNGLGDPFDTRPQMALCRCGQSASKPWCDGSHALVDFTDAKDPNRVTDQRDTYAGIALTVLDNRGLCQHSGFCTDRLPLAFRVDKEPFVAPGRCADGRDHSRCTELSLGRVELRL